MVSSGRDDDLVGQLYDATVRPERLLEVIEAWGARLDAGDPETAMSAGFQDADFLRHLARALAILDEFDAAEERRLDDLLAGMPVAAMVLTETGVVVASSPAARTGLGLFPGGSIRLAPAPRPEIEELGRRLAEVAAGAAGGRDAVLRLSLHERARPVILHLRAVGRARGRRQVLAVSWEFGWAPAVDGVLARVFGLTAAEIALTRRLTAGETVRDIARDGARSEGTVRSQLHSALGKVGLKSQGELVRLAQTMLQAVALEPGPVPVESDPVEARRLMRLSDGRRMAVLRFGDPGGRPILWLMASLGFYQPTASGERELRRRGLRVIVPIRAGYGMSDPAPPGRDPEEVALEDIAEALDQIGVRRCPVVAPFFEIRAALGLAQRWPERVERIVGVGAAFPSVSLARFRRLSGPSRVYVAAIRFAPHLLPFIIRTFHARIRGGGLDDFLRRYYRDTPGDARLFAEREVAEAVVGAFTYARCQRRSAQEAFRLDSLACERPWPRDLGRVACPVALLHGEEDTTAPAATAREMAAAHPGWSYQGLPEAGQLVAYAAFDRILDLAAGADEAAAAEAAE